MLMLQDKVKMDQLSIAFGIILVFATQFIEMKSLNMEENLLFKNHEDTKIPENWKTDERYSLKWKGDFSYGVPADSKCEKVVVPPYGRFICSSGKGLSKVMCLTDCMDGYEHAGKAMVFICTNDGVWMNIFRHNIATPQPECVKSKWPIR